jgi:TonB family protein
MLLLSDRQRRGLNKRLDANLAVQIRASNQDEAPLGITSATLRSSKLDQDSDSKAHATARQPDIYAMKAEVIIVNRTDLRVISAGLEFTDISTNEIFYVYPNGLSIGGRKRYKFEIPLMLVNSEPSRLSIQAVGALFGDSSIWGAFPFPPPLKGGGWEQPAVVDSQPELLSTIHPTYTDEARRNRVKGAVRLELEIGADGVVKRVEILNALPDGLTEEAVRIARHLAFKPAIRRGDPVPCLINLDIEFRGG